MGGLFCYEQRILPVIKIDHDIPAPQTFFFQCCVQPVFIQPKGLKIVLVRQPVDEKRQHGRGASFLLHRGADAAVGFHHAPDHILRRKYILAAQRLAEIGRSDAQMRQSVLIDLAVAQYRHRLAEQ